jgi:hypothetical protein
MLIEEVTIGGLTILILSKEAKGIETRIIRKSIPLFKIILLLMKNKRMKTLFLKSTVLGTPPLFLT